MITQLICTTCFPKSAVPQKAIKLNHSLTNSLTHSADIDGDGLCFHFTHLSTYLFRFASCCGFVHINRRPSNSLWAWILVLRTNLLEEIIYILVCRCIQMTYHQFIIPRLERSSKGGYTGMSLSVCRCKPGTALPGEINQLLVILPAKPITVLPGAILLRSWPILLGTYCGSRFGWVLSWQMWFMEWTN